MACGKRSSSCCVWVEAPNEYSNWTVQLLARQVVAFEIIEAIYHETVQGELKTNGMTRRKIEYRVIPPESDAEFVKNMENFLKTLETPYDSTFPVICYEYEQANTASIFMIIEPLSSWRQATARKRRTKIGWAQ